MNERQPIRNGSGGHDLETPQDNSNGSDDAGSRQGTLQDMDLHCFHPVLVTTPRGGYVIPRCGSNLGIRAFTSWSNIRKRIAIKIWSASKRDRDDGDSRRHETEYEEDRHGEPRPGTA